MVEYKQAFTELEQILRQGGIENSDFEARQLLLHCCEADRFSPMPIGQQEWQQALAMAKKRAEGYPLQYIIGSWGFLDLELEVGPGVLIPRPETEEVCLMAAESLQGKTKPCVLDLCAGSGALALGIQSLVPEALVTAVELDEEAFIYLAKNTASFLKQHGQGPKLVQGDALVYYKELLPGSLDLLVSNPPYVTREEYDGLEAELYFEPEIALVAAEEGLAFYNSFIPNYYFALKPGGWFVFEIGMGQGEVLKGLLQRQGCCNVAIRKDLSGLPRIAMGQKPRVV